MKILVKNSDVLYSKLHKSKVVDEFLVYVMDGRGTPMAAQVVYGTSDKNKAIDAYLKEYFEGNSNLDEILEEVTFTEFKKQLKNG